MIFSVKAQSLEPAKYSEKNATLEQITECPICKASIRPMHLHSVFRVEQNTVYLESHQFCTNCNHSFIGSYQGALNGSGVIYQTMSLKSVEPQRFREYLFDHAIQDLSPQFAKIYNQALAAETSNLDEIAGLGYRKALEFLVKDYAIHEHPGDTDNIKKAPLSSCIRNYIDDNRIKTLAERSVWIGNDEAHYIRKQENRDVTDMKAFIKAIVYFIGMVLITEDAATISAK